jgi:hypothetical protein
MVDKENEYMKKYVLFTLLGALFATALGGCKKGG